MTEHRIHATWRDVLEKQGRSLAWLADRTSVSRRTVYSYSQGARRPSRLWLERAALELGVPADLLLTDDSGKAA